MRLGGAGFHDIREFANAPEQNWGVGDKQLWRYLWAADALVKEHAAEDRDFVFCRSVQRRDHIFAQAMASGDFRTALDADRDLDRLFGLYPEAQSDPRAKPQTSVTLNISELIVTQPEPAALPPIREELVLPHDHSNGTSNGTAATDGPPAPGTAGLPGV
jgi:hypothetical protein